MRSARIEPRARKSLVPAWILLAGGIAVGAAACLAPAGAAFALSEIQQEDAPASSPSPEPDQSLPLPEPIDPAAPTVETPAQGPEDQAPGGTTVPEGAEENGPDAPLPDVQYDTSLLPEPVQRTRAALLDAARSGDLERLRPMLGTGDDQTQLSLGGIEGDPIKFLKEASGDEQGQEILAILEEVLSAGYVRMEAGTPNELYVWPYFFAFPIDKLSAPQRVELFKIVTAGDYEDMKAYGAYIFYRVGIAPDGKWSFFLAGD